MKTVKMYFTKDTFYTDPTRPLYLGGHTYDIPQSYVEKWLKRGALLISDLPSDSPIKKQASSEPTPIKPLTDAPPTEDVTDGEDEEEEEIPKSDKKKSSKGK